MGGEWITVGSYHDSLLRKEKEKRRTEELIRERKRLCSVDKVVVKLLCPKCSNEVESFETVDYDSVLAHTYYHCKSCGSFSKRIHAKYTRCW